MIDFGVEQLPYLVMEFVPGVPLRGIIQAGPLPARRALGIIQQVLAGLAHAHAHGIVHRDVKPENILVEAGTGLPHDHVRILDFGLAKLMDGAAMLTMGMLLGTPWYMPPEQMGESEIDARADIYTAGIVLYEMLTGKKPFEGPSIPEILIAQKEAPPPAFRATAPQLNLSDALEAVVRRALAKNPADRFVSATEMSQALEAVPEITGKPQVAAAPSRAADATVMEAVPWGARAQTAVRLFQLPSLVARLRQGATSGRKAAVERWRLLPPRAQRTVLAVAGASVVVVFAVWLIGRGEPAPADRSPPANTVVAKGRAKAAAGSRAAPGQPRRASTGPAAASEPASDRVQLASTLRERMREHPDDARIPAALARLSFEHRRYREGLGYLRQAIKRDASLRADPVLLGHVIDGLQFDRSEPTASEFLRGVRKQVRPLLTEAAREHESPRVRQRARALLAEGTRKPFFRWR